MFGKPSAVLKSAEHQKRGGTHEHWLIAVPELVDDYICCEIPELPDENDLSAWAVEQRRYHRLVVKKMLHHCNDHCLVAGKCAKNYPKPFSRYTILHSHRPAQHKRRSSADGGQTFLEPPTNSGGVWREFNNSHVVPHNRYLLLKYETHCNIEYVYGKYGCKYAIKYPIKGASFAYVKQRCGSGAVNYDEFNMIFKAHYRSTLEAEMRIHGYSTVRLSSQVLLLPIHLPNDEPVFFNDGEEDEAVSAFQRGEGVTATRQTAFLSLCLELGDSAQHLTYLNVEQEYRFVKGRYQKRVYKKNNLITRIYLIPPRYFELFALRLLFFHVHAPKSYAHLRTVNGHEHENFVLAARALGLLTDDSVWRSTMDEGAKTLRPRELRNLFV